MYLCGGGRIKTREEQSRLVSDKEFFFRFIYHGLHVLNSCVYGETLPRIFLPVFDDKVAGQKGPKVVP